MLVICTNMFSLTHTHTHIYTHTHTHILIYIYIYIYIPKTIFSLFIRRDYFVYNPLSRYNRDICGQVIGDTTQYIWLAFSCFFVAHYIIRVSVAPNICIIVIYSKIINNTRHRRWNLGHL